MNENTLLKRKDGLMTASMNGEAVMMDISTGKYYNLGETGGRIWELLEQPMTILQLQEALVAEYDVTAEQCLNDVQNFIGALMAKELVTEA